MSGSDVSDARLARGAMVVVRADEAGVNAATQDEQARVLASAERVRRAQARTPAAAMGLIVIAGAHTVQAAGDPGGGSQGIC